VGEESCARPQAEARCKRSVRVSARWKSSCRQSADRPRVAFLEWLQPFYIGGHWVPEMIHRAGGEDVFGTARTPSFRIAIEDVIDAAPEILLIAPCGYAAERARDEYKSMSFPEPWHAIPAVRNGRVYALRPIATFHAPGRVSLPASKLSPNFSIPRLNFRARPKPASCPSLRTRTPALLPVSSCTAAVCLGAPVPKTS